MLLSLLVLNQRLIELSPQSSRCRDAAEVLITEANLIKEYRPRYNILMKDDKAYPYIRITNEPFPQVLLARKIVKDGSKYYGPFTDSYRLRTILKVLHKVFPKEEILVWKKLENG